MTNPLFQRVVSGSSSEVYLYHNDHLGTPQQMIARNGSVVWSADYAAFGGAVVSGSVGNNLRFPGQYFDGETGTHYNVFRDYDPSTGRYAQADPRGVLLDFSNPQRLLALQAGLAISGYEPIGTLNQSFVYAGNNSLVYIDPTGEFGAIGVAVLASTAVGVVNGVVQARNGGNVFGGFASGFTSTAASIVITAVAVSSGGSLVGVLAGTVGQIGFTIGLNGIAVSSILGSSSVPDC